MEDNVEKLHVVEGSKEVFKMPISPEKLERLKQLEPVVAKMEEYLVEQKRKVAESTRTVTIKGTVYNEKDLVMPALLIGEHIHKTFKHCVESQMYVDALIFGALFHIYAKHPYGRDLLGSCLNDLLVELEKVGPLFEIIGEQKGGSE